jgi:hypothetical protein
LICRRTPSKNRASAFDVTSAPPRYYARADLSWTLSGRIHSRNSRSERDPEAAGW